MRPRAGLRDTGIRSVVQTRAPHSAFGHASGNRLASDGEPRFMTRATIPCAYIKGVARRERPCVPFEFVQGFPGASVADGIRFGQLLYALT